MSYGIFAQSVGGGGSGGSRTERKYFSVEALESMLEPTLVVQGSGGGDGDDVTVISNGDYIYTLGSSYASGHFRPVHWRRRWNRWFLHEPEHDCRRKRQRRSRCCARGKGDEVAPVATSMSPTAPPWSHWGNTPPPSSLSPLVAPVAMAAMRLKAVCPSLEVLESVLVPNWVAKQAKARVPAM